jgi:hypothetical protein
MDFVPGVIPQQIPAQLACGADQQEFHIAARTRKVPYVPNARSRIVNTSLRQIVQGR